MSPSLRAPLLAGALLASILVDPSSPRAAPIPQDACKLFTAADLTALGISAAPKGRIASSPNQTMSSCGAGSFLKPPKRAMSCSQFHFFKGNVSVLLMCSATMPAARTRLIEIAKRAAAAL